MNGSELVVTALQQQGIKTVFGYPGGAIMPIYDALYDGGVDHVLCRHEQGAAMAAIGLARSTQNVGVCLATSGPGATNLITGLADAMLDSVPIVAITGQVASPLIGTDAFQEVDVLGMSLSCTKHSYLVTDPNELAGVLTEAFEVAQSGRPGPVLVDIAKDVQLAEIDKPHLPLRNLVKTPEANATSLKLAKEMVASSEHPVLYVGGGVQMAKATDTVRNFLEACPMPSVGTLKGLGTIERHTSHYLGMLGMHGTRAANLVVQKSDLLIVVGARFDDRVTGKLDTFAPNAKVIHIDIDAAEFSKLRHAHAPLQGDINTILPQLINSQLNIKPWLTEVNALRAKYAWRYDHPGDLIYAPLLLKQLSDMIPDSTVIATDVGQHQMWSAQHIQPRRPENFLTSAGLGTMGFGLPAAMGVKLAFPEKESICVTGDGSIQMNIQELSTCLQYNLAVKVVSLNNRSLGMVRQWQDMMYSGRHSSSYMESLPDFVKLVESYGHIGIRVDHIDELQPAIEKAMSINDRLVFLDICVDEKEHVYPMQIKLGAVDDMWLRKGVKA